MASVEPSGDVQNEEGGTSSGGAGAASSSTEESSSTSSDSSIGPASEKNSKVRASSSEPAESATASLKACSSSTSSSSSSSSFSSAASSMVDNKSGTGDEAMEADRISIDDISIGSVSGGSASGGGAAIRRQNSVTSRSSNSSASFASAVLPPSSNSSNNEIPTAASVASSSASTKTTPSTKAASASSSSSSSTSSSLTSSFRTLSLSSREHGATSALDVNNPPPPLAANHPSPSVVCGPPLPSSSSRTSPLVGLGLGVGVPSSSSSLPLPSSSSLSSCLSAASCVINLNVGGYTFSTSLSTLVKYEDSMLAVMFSGRHPFSKDREGRYFIDRDGQHFGHILSYLRSDALPPEDAVIHVLREAEFFCLQSLIDKLEASSPRVIAIRRREYFRALIPDYDSIKKSIVGVASQKRTAFEESIVVLTQDNHAKLQGSIPCYNCTREPVCVTHDCTFRGNKSDITVKVKTQDINMDKMIGFIVNELVHDGFLVAANVVLCKFSLRCHSCTMSGLYTAGGILAPRECPNMAHVLTFNW